MRATPTAPPTRSLVAPGTLCRAANGTCDVAEYCVADQATCPPNAFEDTTKVCRAAAAGGCDVAEFCDGAGGCPADGFLPATHVCRAAEGDCDVDELCTGDAAACPSDTFEPSTTHGLPREGRGVRHPRAVRRPGRGLPQGRAA